jgi:Uncharacterised nucleotidyltransferase
MTPWPGVGETLAWVAAFGLQGTTAEAPDKPLEPDGWKRFLDLARRHGLTGLLVLAISEGALPATGCQRDDAVAAHHDALIATLTAERLIVHGSEALAPLDVPVKVLGGFAVAHTDYPDPTARPFRAVRLLVSSTDRPRASLALGRLQGSNVKPRIRWQTRMCESQPGSRYDYLWSYEWIDVAVGGRLVLVPPPLLRLLDACLEAAVDGGDHRLIRDRDIAQVLLTTGVAGEGVAQLARAWRCEIEVAHAIDRAWARLRLADALHITAWATRIARGAHRDSERSAEQFVR